MNLPNKITLSRIIAIVVMIIAMFVLALIPGLKVPAIGNSGINVVYLIFCIGFILAAATDCLDGQIARRCNLVTDLGKFLDPIADKLLNDSMMIFLLVPQTYAISTQRHDPTMLTILAICVIVMIARDLVVDGLRLVAAKKNVVIAANIFGKAKTVLQMVAIPMLLLNDWPFSYFDGSIEALQISNIIFYLATIMSLASGVIYVIQNRKVLKEEK